MGTVWADPPHADVIGEAPTNETNISLGPMVISTHFTTREVSGAFPVEPADKSA